jgi:hypothetical protein
VIFSNEEGEKTIAGAEISGQDGLELAVADKPACFWKSKKLQGFGYSFVTLRPLSPRANRLSEHICENMVCPVYIISTEQQKRQQFT